MLGKRLLLWIGALATGVVAAGLVGLALDGDPRFWIYFLAGVFGTGFGLIVMLGGRDLTTSDATHILNGAPEYAPRPVVGLAVTLFFVPFLVGIVSVV